MAILKRARRYRRPLMAGSIVCFSQDERSKALEFVMRDNQSGELFELALEPFEAASLREYLKRTA